MLAGIARASRLKHWLDEGQKDQAAKKHGATPDGVIVHRQECGSNYFMSIDSEYSIRSTSSGLPVSSPRPPLSMPSSPTL